MLFSAIALQVPKLLLPRAELDLTKWAVVACDQYTSQPAYWKQVEALVGTAPSTLRLMLPEVYLDASDEAQRIADIQATMRRYLAEGMFTEQLGLVLVERTTAHGHTRRGLVAALDLEQYSFEPGSKPLIRPTEGTIVERLPPRVRVREQAPLELPHVMVLIDDAQHMVIDPLFTEKLRLLYDVPLMLNSGRVRGWHVDSPELIQWLVEQLHHLAAVETFNTRYGVQDEPVLLYAMGDGNHSFATAKTIWENLKRNAPDPSAIMKHPARYALVELVNLHDAGLEFEAIHRVLFAVNHAHLLAAMSDFFHAQGMELQVFTYATWEEAQQAWQELSAMPKQQALAFAHQQGYGVLVLEQPRLTLAVASLQQFLDHYLVAQPQTRIDYIHGTATLLELAAQPGNLGFYLAPLDKNDFFRTVIRDGTLPRKTFSMGEADEKRFYLECRQIF